MAGESGMGRPRMQKGTGRMVRHMGTDRKAGGRDIGYYGVR
jgi:hypothetical protein